jgi:soluble lytic murein transglycosylase-like protein
VLGRIAIALLLPVLAVACAACAARELPFAAPTAGPAPSRAAALAAELTERSHALRAGIVAWRATGDPGAGDAPAAVAAAAARIGSIQRELARRPRLAHRVLARLRGRVARAACGVIAARRALDVLNRPRPGAQPRRIRRGPPEPADALLSHYREGRRRSGVSATLLAAVNLIESDFGRVRNDSVSGAQGPMQFMPATWGSYGRGGDVQDPHDAILGAARFLAAAGARHDERGALYRYNPSRLYVTAVMRYARLMRGDPLAFYGFYAAGAAD